MKCIIAILVVLLSSCAAIGSSYKVTIDDGDVLSPPNVFYVWRYFWDSSGAFCYVEPEGDNNRPVCYQKSINESISVEPISSE